MESSMVEKRLKTHSMEEKKIVEQGNFNEEQKLFSKLGFAMKYKTMLNFSMPICMTRDAQERWTCSRDRGEDLRGAKTFPVVKVQIEESKETSLGDFIKKPLKYLCGPSILTISHEEEENRNHNEGPNDPFMHEVVGTLGSLQQEMGNIERNVAALSARIDRQESILGQRRGFHNYENLTPRRTMRD
ncbi:hypothetical protein M9H77_07571 [Catharanthus roseus]|uniref:Uncharacterized protein n=1 Tax=Catharanthus roseus TaxID=4058 RepID=A0ACC0BVC1_CATRO|nr:hypothetical protein M9H77_07571 [Catharanthus roseus]